MPENHSTLIVGYDGSAGAAAAVRWAAAHAATGDRLLVVHARHPALPTCAADSAGSRAKADLDALEETPRALELEIADGSPAAALCDAADATGADGIVVGSRRAGGAHGDTVRQLLQISHHPVTVVPG